MKTFALSNPPKKIIAGLIGLMVIAGTLIARGETVRVTIPYYSAATEPYFQKMAAEFKQKNPDIDIKIEISKN